MRLYDYNASANCYKVRLLLALLGLLHERVAIPVRETPVLELDSGEVIAQSNAILWYLAEGTPYLPDSRLERALVAQWRFFEQERVMSGIGSARFRTLTGRDPVLAATRFAIGEGALAVLEEHLAGRSFLVGERCSIADLSVFGYAHAAPDAGYELDRYPAVGAWLGRVCEQPGFIDDLVPYPENARPGASSSIYD